MSLGQEHRMKFDKRVAGEIALEIGLFLALPIFGLTQLMNWGFAIFAELHPRLGSQLYLTGVAAVGVLGLYYGVIRPVTRGHAEQDFQHRVALRILHARLGEEQMERLLLGEVAKGHQTYRLDGLSLGRVLYDARL